MEEVGVIAQYVNMSLSIWINTWEQVTCENVKRSSRKIAKLRLRLFVLEINSFL